MEIVVGFTPRQGLLQLMPARQDVLVKIIVLLSVLTWIFSGRMHSGHHIQPSQLSSSITPEGRQYLHAKLHKEQRECGDNARFESFAVSSRANGMASSSHEGGNLKGGKKPVLPYHSHSVL